MQMNPKVKLILIILVASVVIVTLGVAIPIFTQYSLDDIFKPEKRLDEDPNYVGRMVLDYVPLIDGHNDLPYNLYTIEKNQINNFPLDSDLTKYPVWNETRSSQTDLLRLRQGKVGGQFWVAYVDCETTQYKDAVERTLEQIDVIKRMIEKYPNDFKYTTTADGIWDAFNARKIASMIGVEGGHSIDSRLAVLRAYYELGVRYMTLTHKCNQPWAEASPIDNDVTIIKVNITEWGKNVVAEMNRLGMLVDISHVSYGVMNAVLNISRAPVMFSHSSAYAVHSHHRNVHDDVLMRLKENGGIIMVNFYTTFIGGNGTIDDVIKHLNHIKNLTGPDHIGIGADYDGITSTPIGLEDVSKYPVLFDRLAESDHGYIPWTVDELKKLAGLNLIRVFKEVEEISKALQEKPYEMLIPDIDLYISANQTCRTDFFFNPSNPFALTRSTGVNRTADIKI